MMKQDLLFQLKSKQQLEYSKTMTVKGKKNSKVKIVANKRKHKYWNNIFRRKRIMSEYFSDSAFGSQSDTKVELYNPWEDPEKMSRYRAKKILEYEYEDPEVINTISLMNDNPFNNEDDM